MNNPEVLLGPPGTGKTTSLLDIVDEELGRGVAPDRIGFVTFTRRGAETAVGRAAERFKLPRKDFPFFRTLHSLAYRVLGLRPGDVMERDRMQDFADYAGVRITGVWCDDGTFAGYEVGDRVLFMENLARMRGVPVRAVFDEDDDRLSWGTVDYVSRAYAAYKEAHGLVDYTGMLQACLERDVFPQLEVLLVDECFLGDTPILVGLDGSWLSIKTMFDCGYRGPVVSWDENTGKTVVKTVVGHKRVVRNKRMLQIKFYPNNGTRDRFPATQIVVCTEDHRVKTRDGWVEAKNITPGTEVYVETAQQKIAGYQHRHKISKVGKRTLSEALTGNVRGLNQMNNQEEKYKQFNQVKGGNGRKAQTEELFEDKMRVVNVNLVFQPVITTGYGRSGNYPPHYRPDYLIEGHMIVVEIDGDSHKGTEAREKDKKKETVLKELGYDVVRFTNKEVNTLTPDEIKDRIFPKCFIPATVVEVNEYDTQETYVYDLEVEDTHCYFAHGLLVHNCQDLSLLQWKVVDRLAQGARRVVVAGDDDQAIYTWAGADVDTLVNMPGRVRVLGQSWRVPRAVQRVADGIIGRVAHRRPKAWAPRPEEGGLGRAVDVADVDLTGKDVLVLARNNYVLREQVEPELRRRGIYYESGGRSAVSPAVMGAVRTWEALRAGGTCSAAEAEQVYRYLTVGRGVARGMKAAVKRAEDDHLTLGVLHERFGLQTTAVWHDALDRLPQDEVSYMLAARRSGEKLTAAPRVRLSTIHGSKGGEAEHVVLLAEMAKRTFVEMRDDEDAEARVFYVGATRARSRLTVVESQTERAYPYI